MKGPPIFPRYTANTGENYPGVGNPIGIPGTAGGPCLECGHLVCNAARSRGTTYHCSICKRPVGFTESYGMDKHGYYHTECKTQNVQREREQCEQNEQRQAGGG